MEQTVKVVIAYIDARPARLHEHFATLASEALKEAFPINNIQLSPHSPDDALISATVAAIQI
jgi:hypothetical protein